MQKPPLLQEFRRNTELILGVGKDAEEPNYRLTDEKYDRIVKKPTYKHSFFRDRNYY